MLCRSKIALLLGAILIAGTTLATPALGHKFFIEKHEVKGTELFTIEGTTGFEKEHQTPESEITGKIGGKKIVIHCEAGTAKDEIEKEGLTKSGELTLKECRAIELSEGKSTALSTCTVANVPIKFKDVLLTGQGATVEIELQPSSGKVFAEFEISGSSCAIKGKAKLESATEGKGQICTPGSIGEVEETTQFMACGPTGSKELRLDGEKAGFLALVNMSIKAEGCGNRKWYME